ncbi:hypothetical protein MIND_00987900 [Mycena indigotica]|uniref:F-box domain-containing protein n=1 Tax=Mycena indigotica TaxID=2126181 RepID=A0A8H6SFR8_9AGAR|nr:uncharacterized protein MIND_00987900 [Mycena indigotica]KAF7297537.1 hypothetical protein MIND_00987900 [Mycena indigotica]
MLPDELLLEILRHLPKGDLFSVTYASRHLCALARTFLYTGFTFHPYVFEAEAAVLRCPPPEQCNELLEQLAFLASQEIAPYVRFVHVRLNRLRRNHPDFVRVNSGISFALFADEDDTDAMLPPFFFTLEAFRNLRVFDAQRLLFTSTALAALAQLQSLEQVSMWDCTLALSLPLLPTQAKMHVVSLSLLQGDDPDLWLQLVVPAALRKLYVSGAHEFGCADFSSLPVFANLADVTIPLRQAELSAMLPLLNAAFPSMELLRIDGGSRGEADAYVSPSNAFDHLKELHGRRNAAVAFLALASIHVLTLHITDAPTLLASFGVLPSAAFAALTNLSLQLERCDTSELLGSILGHFPVLQAFTVDLALDRHAHRAARHSILALVTTLPPLLPPTLHILRLYAQAYGRPDAVGPDADYAIPDPRVVHTQAVERCPKLAVVEIRVPLFRLRWTEGQGFEGEGMGSE